MALHNDLGKWGEERACRYLMKQGYRLLSRNWRFHHLEVDIVAEWYGELVFVEVKTRSNEEVRLAKDAVDLEKKENLIHAAAAYLKYYQLDQPYRFDIITIVGEVSQFELQHIENAFTVAGVSDELQSKSFHLPQ